MTALLAPAVYVVLLWWLLTGVVLYLDGLPRKTFPWTVMFATVILVLAVIGVLATRSNAATPAIYCAVTCGLLIWGYLELTYLTGVITGPVKHACPPDTVGFRRFALALQTSIYHELVVVGTGLTLFFLTAGAANPFAFQGFLVLWVMRWSAKLNAFFGVRNLNENWLPEHLVYLASYMRRRAMNPFFPVSVGVATLVAIYLFSRVDVPVTAESTGRLLVLTLLVLAILEHLLLVMPLDISGAWRWGFRSHQRSGHPTEKQG